MTLALTFADFLDKHWNDLWSGIGIVFIVLFWLAFLFFISQE